MSHHNLAGGPCEDEPQRGASRGAVCEGRAELPGHCRHRLGHEIQPRHEAAPPLEPARRELLEEVREEDGPAGTMEEDDFGRDAISTHNDLIKIFYPLRRWLIRQFPVDALITEAKCQARRPVEPGIRIALHPFDQEPVVQRIWSDHALHRAEFGEVSVEAH